MSATNAAKVPIYAIVNPLVCSHADIAGNPHQLDLGRSFDTPRRSGEKCVDKFCGSMASHCCWINGLTQVHPLSMS